MKSIYILVLLIVVALSKRAIHQQNPDIVRCVRTTCGKQSRACFSDQTCTELWDGCVAPPANDDEARSCILNSGNELALAYEKCFSANCIPSAFLLSRHHE